MTATVGIHEAKTTLSQLISRVESGEEIIISRSGTPVVKLVQVASESRPQRVGALKGRVPQFTDSEWAELDEQIRGMFRS
jgi:prevent-host-death family protein